MSSWMLALIFAVGAAAWTYAKITRRTGGNTKSDATVAAIAGILAFFVFWSILNAIGSAV